MKHLAATHWPEGTRRGYCWLPPGSDKKCIMKVGGDVNDDDDDDNKIKYQCIYPSHRK